ncbi:MAG TPA: bifunctional riboflavin kinase/FAD synthetase [Saprospiraceae bacterium]|nr:bifunctional riboflavin kinase/FAD synthetase [Saprospiraceae bacterium]
MMVHHDLNELPAFQNAVITIGSFDGLHLGHQKIIEHVRQLAKQVEGESILITFHPHPRLVIYPKDNSLRLLSTIDEKVRLLETFGLDHLVIVPFSTDFSQQSADEYIVNFLVGKFHPSYIVIGYDHRFGLNRQGDIDFLRHYQDTYGYQIKEIPRQDIDDLGVSSTKIRKALQAGKIKKANRLLGQAYTLSGKVVHGQQIGQSLGFPTANLEINHTHKLVPPNGIYAVQVFHRESVYGGMLYIGDRPSIKEHNNQTIEVNIFDFDQRIYGDNLVLELVDFIRGDQQYGTLTELSAQLAKDKQAALEILAIEQTTPLPRYEAKVAIVILNYNGKTYLETFLPTVKTSAYQHLEIIVADNGSTDQSLDFMAAEYPNVRIIDLQENYGFAEGYNRALEQVEADYFVLLNSDVEVTPGWITPIIDLMEKDKEIAACQPKIRSYEQRDHFEYAGASGGWLDFLGYPFCRGRIFNTIEADTGQYDDVQEIFWASGAAMFIRSRLFKQIDGFDGDYFAHAEEIDLCWRLKRAGYKIMVQPKSVVYHVGGGTLNYTTPFKTYLNFRNTLYTILKNEPIQKLLWLIPLRLILDGLAAGLFFSQRKFPHIRSILRAHGRFYTSFRKTWRKRQAYNEKIRQLSIQPEPNLKGQYRASIVWKYYATKKRYFYKL